MSASLKLMRSPEVGSITTVWLVFRAKLRHWTVGFAIDFAIVYGIIGNDRNVKGKTLYVWWWNRKWHINGAGPGWEDGR